MAVLFLYGGFMANRNEQIKELTDRLEEGVRDVFESGRYEEYLRVMSKFHHYSYRNILLIQMQKPDATRVAGYETWKKKFGSIHDGEKNAAYYVDSVGFREVRDFLKGRDEQVIDESMTACSNGAKHISETEHLGTGRMKETIKDPVHEKPNDIGERDLNAAHKSVGSDEQPATQIKDKTMNDRSSRDKARHKRQSKRKAR